MFIFYKILWEIYPATLINLNEFEYLVSSYLQFRQQQQKWYFISERISPISIHIKQDAVESISFWISTYSRAGHISLLFILKVLWCSNNLIQKRIFKTPSICKVIHMKVFFRNFAQKVKPFSTILSYLIKCPVHLELFRPFASEVLD